MIKQVLDQLDSSICLVNESGTIVFVNQAWKDLAIQEGATKTSFEGKSYFQNGQEDQDDEFLLGIKEVLTGKKDEVSVHFPFHFPKKPWFNAKVRKVNINRKPHVIIIHDKSSEEITLFKQVQLLFHVSEIIYQAPDFTIALKNVLEVLCESSQWAIGEIWVPKKDMLRYEGAYYCTNRDLEDFCKAAEELQFEKGVGLPGIVWEKGEYHWMDNLTENNEFMRSKLAKQLKLGSALGVPVKFNDTLYAIIAFYHLGPKKRDPDIINLILSVAKHLGLLFSQKRLEKDLKKKRDYFKTIINDIPDMVVRWDRDGTITFANEEFLNLFSSKNDKVLGRSLFSLIPEKDAKGIKNRVSELSVDKPVSSDIHQVIFPNNNLGWLYWIDRAIFDEVGNVIEYQSAGRDLTSEILAKKYLEENEHKLSIIFENASDSMCLIKCDKDHYHIMAVNPAFINTLELLGVNRTHDDLLDLELSKVYKLFGFSSETVQEKVDNVRRAHDSAEKIDFLVVIEHNQKRIYGSSQLIPVIEEGDVSYILWTSRDITSAKNYEKKLEESEKRFRRVFNQQFQFTALLDKNGKVLHINDLPLQTQGLSKEDYLGKYFWESPGLEGNKLWQDKVKAQIFHAKETGEFIEVVDPYYGKAQEIRHAKASYSVINDVGGEIEYVLVQAIDVTDEKAYKMKLEQTVKELNQLKGQLEAENFLLRESINNTYSHGDLIYTSKAFQQVVDNIESIAHLDTPVLLTGETGTGKEIVTTSIHKLSNRSDQALIQVNCGAIPKDLIESELFGYEKGAFTGATKSKPGRFALAEGGTLMLDEIGEMPLETQVKLLRVLQNNEVEPLGSVKPVKVDVRIIAATNRDLQEEIKENNFREDLFYRLNVFPIHIPPLRERREDIPTLVKYFVEKFSKKYDKSIKTISRRSMEYFHSYNWPGNIRELENLIERSVILSKTEKLYVPDLEGKEAVPLDKDFLSLDEVQRQYILNVLKSTNWKITGEKGAASKLDLKPSTLRDRMKKLDIQRIPD